MRRLGGTRWAAGLSFQQWRALHRERDRAEWCALVDCVPQKHLVRARVRVRVRVLPGWEQVPSWS